MQPRPPPLEELARRLSARPLERGPAAPFASIALLLAPYSLQPQPSAAPLQLLLIERATREGDPWSGHMALPGGRVDPADADPLAAAIRETREETGIEVTAADLLGELDDVFPRDTTAGRFVVRPFVFALPGCPPLTLSDEVAKALWVPLADLAACACTAEVDHRGATLAVPAYRCGPHVVWGLTHRVVSGLLDLLPMP